MTPAAAPIAAPSAAPNLPATACLRVLIADDEPLARLLLRQRLSQCTQPLVEVVGEAANAREVLALLAQPVCDAVLLDIHMPGMDGLQLAQQLLARPQPTAVIFVSAHAEHALRAFELHAVDYLTKPVGLERLQLALQRVVQRTASAQQSPPPSALMDQAVLTLGDRQHLLRIPLADIIMARAADKRVVLTTVQQQEHSTDESLAELEPRLGAEFVRVHRNSLVALRAIRELRLHTAASAIVSASASGATSTAAPGVAADDAGGAGGAEGDVWMVRVAPGEHWLPVSRRQLAVLRAALERV
jgi:two-component system, LytTR family, response regulator AlgR